MFIDESHYIDFITLCPSLQFVQELIEIVHEACVARPLVRNDLVTSSSTHKGCKELTILQKGTTCINQLTFYFVLYELV